jgi:hypothetical protein
VAAQSVAARLTPNAELRTPPTYLKLVPQEKAVFERVADALIKKDVEARTACSAAVKPVTHTLVITAVK